MTQGVVSVSVSAVVYTRILVSDRIGVCPYRPFSNKNKWIEAIKLWQPSEIKKMQQRLQIMCQITTALQITIINVDLFLGYHPNQPPTGHRQKLSLTRKQEKTKLKTWEPLPEWSDRYSSEPTTLQRLWSPLALSIPCSACQKIWHHQTDMHLHTHTSLNINSDR